MGKNLFFLVVLVWAANSMAKTPVHQETLADSDKFKVEKAEPEKEGRFVAGEKKKKAPWKQEDPTPAAENSDSEVRYWQYQE